MEEEYSQLEQENNRLQEIAYKAKGTSMKLEKIVYGIPGNPSKSFTSFKKSKRRKEKEMVF